VPTPDQASPADGPDIRGAAPPHAHELVAKEEIRGPFRAVPVRYVVPADRPDVGRAASPHAIEIAGSASDGAPRRAVVVDEGGCRTARPDICGAAPPHPRKGVRRSRRDHPSRYAVRMNHGAALAHGPRISGTAPPDA